MLDWRRWPLMSPIDQSFFPLKAGTEVGRYRTIRGINIDPFSHLYLAEHALLKLAPVDSDAAACYFVSIAYQVVLFATCLAWIGIEQGDVFIHRRGEEMVAGVPALLLLVPLDKGKVNHPA